MTRMTGSVMVLALLTGCVALPTNNLQLDRARAEYHVLRIDAHSRSFAPDEFKQVDDAMNEANEGWMRNDDPDEVTHLAYMAYQRMAIAREVALRKRIELQGTGR